MKYPVLQLAIKHIITVASETAFEKDVFADTYAELWMQAQAYNPEGRFTTLAEIIAANPKAFSLHYKTRFAIGLYMDALQRKIPGTTDNGGNALTFDNYQFEILHSYRLDKTQHAVAFTYLTPPYRLLHSIGHFMVLADAQQEGSAALLTIEMKPGITVASWTAET